MLATGKPKRQPLDEKSDRAPLSSPAALISGLILLIFLGGEWRNLLSSQQTWPIYAILIWGIMFAIGLIIWSFREWFGIHWIGNPTLTVIGGVSGAIITAVALVLTLQASANQDRASESQLNVLREQLRVMQDIDRKLSGTTSSSPAPASPALRDTPHN